MNRISGKRYKRLATSSAMTELRSAAIRAPGKSGSKFSNARAPIASNKFQSKPVRTGRYLQGWEIRGGFCGTEVGRRNGSRDMCRKRPQNHGNGFAVRKKRNLLYHQYSSGAVETQALPCAESERVLRKPGAA